MVFFLLQSVLNNYKLLEKSDYYDLVHPWLGFGLLTR